MPETLAARYHIAAKTADVPAEIKRLAHGTCLEPGGCIRTEGLRVGVVRNSHVALIPITVGQDYGDAVEVLSGLTARDAVIVNPSDSLANGAQVQVESRPANGVRQ